jgi:chemotaxis protein methyltransferase CheR
VEKHKCKDIHDLLHKILSEPDFFTLVLCDLTITVTELFRDPPVYKSIREKVIPYLKTYPEIKIWFAGCASGDEVYSTAIVLKEEGLLERCTLYGTDVNPVALKRAKEGVISTDHAKKATARYTEAGGKASLEDYYTENFRSLVLNSGLKERIVFSDHNLATDGVFGEMQLIFCRNVLIYFKRPLHDRAIQLFANSLCPTGFLCLGSKETLNFSVHRDKFDEFLKDERIYKRKLSLVPSGVQNE